MGVRAEGEGEGEEENAPGVAPPSEHHRNYSPSFQMAVSKRFREPP